MNACCELKKKAAEIELEAVDTLDGKGRRVTSGPEQVQSVRFTFVDGEVLTLQARELQTPEFDALQFKLRPFHNHS